MGFKKIKGPEKVECEENVSGDAGIDSGMFFSVEGSNNQTERIQGFNSSQQAWKHSYLFWFPPTFPRKQTQRESGGKLEPNKDNEERPNNVYS